METVAAPATAGPEMNRAVNALRGNAIEMAKAIRSADPGDPRSYQLLRAVLWLPVQDLPPAEGGRTMLPDPTGELGPILSTLSTSRTPLDLLEFCERTAVDNLFWLDLHRHAAEALDALGHAAARAALIGGTAAFLKRFPGLPELAFDGGTAFADTATRLWISEDLLAGANGGGTRAGAGTERESEVDEVRARALALAAAGGLGDAVALLDEARDRAVDGRSRFRWEIEKARLCLEAGRPDPAMSLLMDLDEQADHLHLEVWEPSLSIALTVLLLRGSAPSTAAASDPEIADLRLGWQRRLSRLDMRSAIELIS